jgi:hypothetical protein
MKITLLLRLIIENHLAGDIDRDVDLHQFNHRSLAMTK